MATSGSGTSSAATVAAFDLTAGEWVAKWRLMLEDTLTPYLWSNEEIITHADYIQKKVAAECLCITDRVTAATCEVSLSQGDGIVAIDQRIININFAHLDSSVPLNLRDTGYMDTHYPGWHLSSADEGTPHTLVTEGVGRGNAWVYPPLDTVAGDTMKLVVTRMPLETLVYSEHSGEPFELDQVAWLWLHGIMYLCYMKQDADTYDPKRAEQHRVLWEGLRGTGGDFDKVKRFYNRRASDPSSASPMKAFM